MLVGVLQDPNLDVYGRKLSSVRSNGMLGLLGRNHDQERKKSKEKTPCEEFDKNHADALPIEGLNCLLEFNNSRNNMRIYNIKNRVNNNFSKQ